MDQQFWLARWENDEIGFHQPQVNPWLKRCWPDLGVAPGAAVFVPLCGKSLDLRWLAEQGYAVFGVELAETAVRAFFAESEHPLEVRRLRHLQVFSAGPVTLYCGDFMDLTALQLPAVTAVYDRASLIALPPKLRLHYADHLQRIVGEGCRMLLLTLEYDQQQVAGPPHAVDESEVRTLFGARCEVERLCSGPVCNLPPKFAAGGIEQAVEVAYRLTKRS